MLYELRIYRCMPGRLPEVLKRFENHTLKIWEKYGIQQAGFWTTQIGGSNCDLTYLLKWNSLAEREEKWAAFSRDADYAKARVESEAAGPLVQSVSNQILTPTRFSAAA